MRILVFLIFICLSVNAMSQIPDVDSLINLAEKKEGREKALLYSDISYYLGFYDTKLSEEYARKCMNEALQTNDSLLIAEGYNALAIALYKKSDYENSLENNKKALSIRLRHGDEYSLLSSYSKIGNCLHDLGRYDEAIPYYLKSLKIAEENKLIQQAGLINNNLAEIFMNQEDYKKAEENYLKAIQIASELQDTLGLTNAIVNLGISAMRQKHYQKADSLYKVGEVLMAGKNYLDLEAGLLINFGVLYKEWGQPEKSISYYKKSVDIYLKTGEKHGLAIVYSNLGNSFLQQGKPDSAYTYYTKGLELAKETNSLTRMEYAYKSLSNFYQAENDYRNAFRFDSIADVLQDSIFTTEKTKIIEELNTRYETQKKEKQLAWQETEITRQQLKVERKNYQLLTAAGSIFTLLLIGFFIFRSQKAKQEKLRQQVALEKAEALNKLQQEKLRISRDLHDNIGSQLTFVVSSLDNLNYISDEKQRENRLAQLGDFTKNTMRQLRESIWALNSENISIEQLESRLAEFINQAKNACPTIKFSLQRNNSGKTFNSNQAIHIYRTVQEAINNAIKHAQAQNIKLIISDSHFSVSDDGIGFEKEKLIHGNGLENMKARMKEAGLETEIISSPGKGTTINIRYR